MNNTCATCSAPIHQVEDFCGPDCWDKWHLAESLRSQRTQTQEQVDEKASHSESALPASVRFTATLSHHTPHPTAH